MTPKKPPEAPLTALEHGQIEIQGRFMYGSNYTFLVSVNHEGQSFQAVYKPRKGEQILWDFPEASLAGREVAAYLLSRGLGVNLVPPTLLREGPFGPGSLQLFIDHNPNLHYFTFKPADIQRLRPVALFDLLANNADRKGGHILLEKRTRALFLIDHGLCFHAEPKLRTVIWDFAGEDFTPDLLAALELLHQDLKEHLLGELQTYLSETELEALLERLEALRATPVFPIPPEDRRSFPFPPI